MAGIRGRVTGCGGRLGEFLAGVVAAACVLTPNGQLAIQTHAAPISAPRLDTRAVQFAAFVQEMTTREQELLEQVKAAAATDTFAGPVSLAATDPLATAGGVVVDAIKALGVAVVEAAKSTAVSVVSIPLIMLNRAATDPFYLPWLPIGLVAYAFTLPFQVVGTFAYDLVANLTQVVTALVPAAAGPAPAAADSPASVAANPSPTAANPVQQAIDTVKTRVTDATNAAGSAWPPRRPRWHPGCSCRRHSLRSHPSPARPTRPCHRRSPSRTSSRSW